jgi:hypothetical protein
MTQLNGYLKLTDLWHQFCLKFALWLSEWLFLWASDSSSSNQGLKALSPDVLFRWLEGLISCPKLQRYATSLAGTWPGGKGTSPRRIQPGSKSSGLEGRAAKLLGHNSCTECHLSSWAWPLKNFVYNLPAYCSSMVMVCSPPSDTAQLSLGDSIVQKAWALSKQTPLPPPQPFCHGSSLEFPQPSITFPV